MGEQQAGLKARVEWQSDEVMEGSNSREEYTCKH
jgi:hypothetical protein